MQTKLAVSEWAPGSGMGRGSPARIGSVGPYPLLAWTPDAAPQHTVAVFGSCARWPATSGERLKRHEACEKTQRSLPLTACIIQLNSLDGLVGMFFIAPPEPLLGSRRQRIPDFTFALVQGPGPQAS